MEGLSVESAARGETVMFSYKVLTSCNCCCSQGKSPLKYHVTYNDMNIQTFAIHLIAK
jgi:hypothetical protein